MKQCANLWYNGQVKSKFPGGKLKKLAFIFISLYSTMALSKGHKLFVVKNNFLPNNVLHFEANLEDDCKINKSKPLSVYWTVSGNPEKVPPGFPEKAFLNHQFSEYSDDSVVFTNRALAIFGVLKNDEMVIKTERGSGDECEAYVEADSNDFGVIRLKSLYGNMKLLLGVPYGVNYFEAKAIDENGELISKKLNFKI
ncbi:MAG: hypothetical protein VYD54_10465 [Bdellovibrionota bacterium]|nr:hypothetical protein [Bdellovibrionota bacterium]